MSHLVLNASRSIAMLAVAFAIPCIAMAQQSAPASFADSFVVSNKSVLDTEPPPAPLIPAQIIEGFLQAEKEVRESLNQHTFRRDVTLQTVGPNNEVTGEYIRNSQFVFDDRGRRIERVLYHPRSTIREMRITKEDIQDLAEAQLLGIDISDSLKYQFSYAGLEPLDGRNALVINVTPGRKPDPHRMRDRFFVGRVWIDPSTFQILKVKGITEPRGKQRFPLFETSRTAIHAGKMFPTKTQADDILQFPERDVRFRISVRYYDYKRFSSQVKVVEIAEVPAQ